MSKKLSCDLNTVRADFDAWRQRRRGRERIPDALWAAAVGLLNHYPFSVVCRELRLSPRDLRKRRTAAGHPPLRSRPGSSAFLELTARDLATAAGTRVNDYNLWGLKREVVRMVAEKLDTMRQGRVGQPPCGK